jgi:Rrf2 family protein
VGGYALGKPAREISLLQVYEAMEGRMKLVACMDGKRGCAFFDGCAQASVWRRVTGAVEEILGQTTVQDLLQKPPANKMGRPTQRKEKRYARAGA